MRFRIPFRPFEIALSDKPEKTDDEAPTTDKTDDRKEIEPTVVGSEEKEVKITTYPTSTSIISEDVQYGVQSAEAVNAVWTKQQLLWAYILIWVIHFIQAFMSGIVGTLTPYVTSAFEMHSLTATTSILSSLIGGLFKLPYCKLIDVWGRPQGFALMVASLTLGLIMMAGCNNVQTYCAAQVFYYIGYNGIDFSLSIFIADTTHLKNRGFWFAYASTPYLITTWVYGPAVTSILNSMGFRWGFGIWCIVNPLICAPLFALFWHNQKKAEKQGLLPARTPKGGAVKWLLHYGREFDVPGLLLVVTGLSLFLLSFSIYSYQAKGWASPLIICFIVFGSLLLVAFALYEKYFAPVTFIPWPLLMDRTIMSTYTMALSLYMGWYLWDSYFYSYLIVIYNLSVTNATYISNIYTMGACFWAVVVGIYIRYTGRVKGLALWFGVPFTILAVGLMIHFRQPDVNIGYIVMCQIFIALAGGTLVICEQVIVMAVSDHQNIPAVLALEAMFANIGGSVGSTVAAALWTAVFPVKLMKYLPSDAQANFATIYGSMTVQASYPMGSPTRTAINHAYGDTQKLMLITATCLYSITWISTALWRDVNVKEYRQMKGRVF